MQILIINGVDVSKLVSYGWNEPLVVTEESQRDLSGRYNVDPVAHKITLTCTCGMLKWNEISTLLKAIDGDNKGTNISVRYADPKQGIMMTKNFVILEKSTPQTLSLNNELYWEGLTFTLEEI